MLVTLLPATGGLALLALAGEALVRALRPSEARHPAARRLALGFLVGTTVTTLLLFGANRLGLPLDRGAWIVTPLLLLGAGWIVARWRTAQAARAAGGRDATDAIRASDAGGARHPVDTAGADPLARLLVGATAAALLGLGALSVHEGASFVDSRTVWMLGARALSADQGFDGRYYEHWETNVDRRDYPPLAPLLGAGMHALRGTPDDAGVKLAHVAWLVALVVLLHHASRAALGPRAAAGASLLFCVSGSTVAVTLWGTADLPLAALLLGALVVLLDEDDTRSGPARFVLAGVLAAGAAFTKSEGALGVGALLVAHGVHRWCRRDTVGAWSWASSVPLVAAPALVLLAWQAFCRAHGLESRVEPLGLEGLGDRLGLVLGAYGTEVVAPRWLGSWALLLLLALPGLGPRAAAQGPGPCRGVSAAGLGAFVLALATAYAAVYVLALRETAWQLQTSLARIAYHAWPAAWLLLLLRAGRRSEDAPGDGTSP